MTSNPQVSGSSPAEGVVYGSMPGVDAGAQVDTAYSSHSVVCAIPKPGPFPHPHFLPYFDLSYDLVLFQSCTLSHGLVSLPKPHRLPAGQFIGDSYNRLIRACASDPTMTVHLRGTA